MAAISQYAYYSRKGPSGFYLPTGNNPYTFLTTLLSYGKIGLKVGGIAESVLSAAQVNINTHNIKSGLEFLKQAADIQRSHEIAYIRERIKDLQELGKDGKIVKQISKRLEQMENGTLDYKSFIQDLNTVINDLERYQTRVKAFNTTAISNIPQVRMVENLATMIGSYADSRDSIYYSQEEAIRQLTLRWLESKGEDFVAQQIANGITGGIKLAAAMALISQQMARFIYDNRKLKERHTAKDDPKGKFADFKSPEEFADWVNSIDLKEFEKYTNMSKILNDNQLLDEIAQMYGITYDPTVFANGRRIRNSASKEIQELKSLIRNEPLITDNFKDIMNHIKINWNGKQGGRNKLAFENELVSALAKGFTAHEHMGRTNMATDMLLGYMGISIDFEDDNGEISHSFSRISTRLHSEGAINDPTKTSKIYLEEMQKLNDSLSRLRQGFVIHETTKNYNTLEKGKWPQGMNSFSGREMNLTNYILSVEQMGAISGIDTQGLRLIANNLATDAIGHSLKEPLEHLLAIFGGIIMFDDFAIIGREVTAGLSFANVQNMHLYRLQDTYFPASMFLDATYKAMMELEDELLAGNGFTANITVPTINYYDQNGQPNLFYGTKFAQRWEGVRTFAEANTDIHLYFASNFLLLMQQLLP